MNPTTSLHINKYGAIKEYNYWRTSTMKKKKSRPEKQKSSFYNVIRPVIYCLRLIGVFPYSEHTGTPRFKMFSWWTLYSLIIVIVEIILLYLRTMILFSNEKNIFDSKLRTQINALINLFKTFGPITLWLEMKGIVEYFSKWLSFQEDLNTYNIALDTRLKKWTYGLMLACFIYIISVSYFDTRNNGGIVHFPVVMIIHATISFTLLLLFILGLFNQYTATSLIKFMKKSQQTTEIVVSRKLWIKLANLTTELGNVLGPTMIQWLLLGSIVTIITSYSLIYIIDGIGTDDNHNQIEMIKSGVFFLIISCFALIFLCEFGNRCTFSVGTKVQTELLHLNFVGRDKEFQQEVNVFIETIHFRFPQMVLCGFFTLNRQYLVSLISGGITYLIVLVQFRSSQT